MNKLLLMLLLVIAVANSCSKQKEEITLKGRIMNVTDSLPYGNTSFIIYQSWTGSNYNRTTEKTFPFTTDNNGYFNFKYELGNRVVMLCWPQGKSKLIKEVQLDFGGVKEHDFGTVYAAP